MIRYKILACRVRLLDEKFNLDDVKTLLIYSHKWKEDHPARIAYENKYELISNRYSSFREYVGIHFEKEKIFQNIKKDHPEIYKFSK